MTKDKHTDLIRAKAHDLGFSFVGIAKAEKMDEESQRLEDWLNKNHHGGMAYMANHFELRTDPTKLVSGAKSVISLMYNYHTDLKPLESSYKISTYAYGRDYHKVVRKKMKQLLAFIREEIGEIDGRAFVDSAPVLERDWAKRSGMGWIGKNTLLINPKVGSYYFLSEIISDLDLVSDEPIKDYCGTCTKCIDACPTDAISENGYVVDGSKCISYLTIELKENIPLQFKDQMEDWIFGCDICQEVCPWNRFAERHNESEFEPKAELLEMTKTDWQEITEEVFNHLFEGTPVKRTKYEGLRRNINFSS
ncbi:tRNA epoxyqueuosine(34) reductase QueG [Portibacter lacus]|uniref:Epoxyqueuosine reductase n=1 Tax=Portibacter lacus TaxID=1099794 RepID=A0AA37STL5_9BACT|nr:tRNA epoxyqueuosine(34) reductase QueG [Portibacter lacus]GLR17973.1 epoxyqueuosine reductase [Portibacter lacus]